MNYTVSLKEDAIIVEGVSNVTRDGDLIVFLDEKNETLAAVNVSQFISCLLVKDET